jgi:hypothetical protein
MEKNTFERVRTPTMRETCDDESALGKIDAPDGSNEYGEDVGEHQGGDGMEPRDGVFDPPYDYLFDPSPEVSERVRDRAGAGGLWPLRITLD